MKKVWAFSVFVALGLAVVVARPIRAYVTAKHLSASNTIVALKWSSSSFPISFQLDPVQGANVTGTRTLSDVINQAFQAWGSVVPVPLQQGAPAPSTAKAPQLDGVNLITTNSTSGSLPAGVLAITYTAFTDAGQIVEADMAFSATFPFSLNAGAVSGQTDLQAVATHEAGHFLGMDHSSNVSSTMFWSLPAGFIYPRNLSADDIAGISTLYPPTTFASTGTLSGTVRTTGNVPVFGAIVVAVDSNGTPVASSLTDPNGAYTIQGLAPGNYTVYSEPLTGRISSANIGSLSVYPGSTVNTNFTTRYH